jgi:uncharacterized protein YdcH (DUF465 family)
MIPEMPALIPASQQMNSTFYKTGEGNNELENQIRLVETLKQVLFLEENKLENMMKQTKNPPFQDLARHIRISSPTAINRSFDETIKCRSTEIINERMSEMRNQKELEEFRNFWSFDGKLEETELKGKDNTIIMEDLVVEEVTNYRARKN